MLSVVLVALIILEAICNCIMGLNIPKVVSFATRLFTRVSCKHYPARIFYTYDIRTYFTLANQYKSIQIRKRQRYKKGESCTCCACKALRIKKPIILRAKFVL